jgi:hypothetical protein
VDERELKDDVDEGQYLQIPLIASWVLFQAPAHDQVHARPTLPPLTSYNRRLNHGPA